MTQPFTFGLKTYRSYFQQATTKLPFSPGEVTALVGANNAGKSCLIRAVYELRNYFPHIANRDWTTGDNLLHESSQHLPNMFLGVADPLDLVPELLIDEDRSIEFEIETDNWRLNFRLSGEELQIASRVLRIKVPNSIDINRATTEVTEIASLLQNSLFIGPYRNISNQAVAGGVTHYDLPVGQAFIVARRLN